MNINQLYYLELSNDPIRFDAVSQLTNVFFDDSNRQVFAVRSGGATGIVVKGPRDTDSLSFCMDDKGPIRSIKFSPDNRILAIQRIEDSVEFIGFNQQHQPNLNECIPYKSKNTQIFGFVWIHQREVALFSSGGVELFTLNIEKRQIKLSKSLNLTINWFSWCPTSNLCVLSSNNGQMLTPVLLKPNIITKLPKLNWENDRPIPERDVTLAQIYGMSAILILRPTPQRMMEVVVYLLNGPGLLPQKSHILRLGLNGRFAMNIVDDLIVVHHQASSTSLLFDIALTGEVDASGISCHSPLTPAKSIKPFTLPVPSISFVTPTKKCELYSTNWVLFQPNIVIDAKLGCLWYVNLQLDALCSLITDRVLLVEFLLQRTNGKTVLLEVLREMMTSQFIGTMLPVIDKVFDRLNVVYEAVVTAELQTQIAQPSSAKTPIAKPYVQPRVLIDQADLHSSVFVNIADTSYVGAILMLYLNSLAKHKISAQHDISKMIIVDLVRNNRLEQLRKLIEFSLINESKVLACFLLSLSNVHSSITQMALDMLNKLHADSIIVEVLLGQGKVVDALRLANSLSGADWISARKYLEAAAKSNDSVVFYTVYNFFVERNVRLRGSPEFLKSELCSQYIEQYQNMFSISPPSNPPTV